MECVVYFGELKEDYKNADNPIVTLENREELFIGLGIFSVANEYFGKSYKFDWGSFVWECPIDKLKKFSEESRVKIPNINNLDETKKYGIVFIELG